MVDGLASQPLSVAGLFAGIGGLELGFERAGLATTYLCEVWEPARTVLGARFPGVPVDHDVRSVDKLPVVDVVTAGFPCTDLSQAGRTAGIFGEQSGLVRELFRLLGGRRRSSATWVVIENVRNMTVLAGGMAMRYVVDSLEGLGYRWAYRVVDSRFTGVPQRRQRVIFVASRSEDPREVLFADDAGERPPADLRTDAFGFYWTEGLRGLGWAQDAVPTLKGGSSVGIPSAPGIWAPNTPVGHGIVSPMIEEAEALQGFPRGWTDVMLGRPRADRTRWKLVGNAVTVGVAAWLGGRLQSPGPVVTAARAIDGPARWPLAAWGAKGRRSAVDASLWPVHLPYTHLAELVDLGSAEPLSARATSGFLQRLRRGGLKVAPAEFHEDVARHLRSYGVSVIVRPPPPDKTARSAPSRGAAAGSL
jgi:DNA (cytosine-5)-methyltransferase 1